VGQDLSISMGNITCSKLQSRESGWGVGVMLDSELHATRVGKEPQGRKGRAVG